MRMERFRVYLEKKKFVLKSVDRIIGIANHFLKWLESKNMDIGEASYNDLLNYIGCLQELNKKNRLINEYLRAISHYYDYKKLANITIAVRLLGETKMTLPLFKEEELDNIYQNYKPDDKGIYRHTDKLLLGLIIYQALDRQHIYNLRLEDLNLVDGKLHVQGPWVKRSGTRVLKLESHQVFPFNDFICKKRLNYNDKLFSRACATFNRLNDQLFVLYKKVRDQSKSLGIDVVRLSQLRQSRYLIWIGRYGIRKTQYLAGFRCPSSMQVYLGQDLEGLKEDVGRYHPLR